MPSACWVIYATSFVPRWRVLYIRLFWSVLILVCPVVFRFPKGLDLSYVLLREFFSPRLWGGVSFSGLLYIPGVWFFP